MILRRQQQTTRWSTLAGLLIIGGLAGCCKHRCFSERNRDPRPYLPPPPRSPYLLPPANVPTTPAPPASENIVPPVIPPADSRQYMAPSGPSWLAPPTTPANPGDRPPPEILLPDALPPANGGSSSQSQQTRPSPAVPAPSSSSPSSTANPPHLPGYTRVKYGVASGRRPTLDGFDALQRAGFRTVVYLHGPQADLPALRQILAPRRLELISLEVTPESLPQTIEQFNAIVADAARQPMYVFDDDGLRAGILWYLHLRIVDALNDDAARIRARSLGLPEHGEELTPFLLAAQRYLSQR